MSEGLSPATDGLAKAVGEVFSPGGAVARAVKGYEPRPGQLRLALSWAEALSRGHVLLAEAATGIGKTLAYLVPAVLSGRKTIVSTATRTLQQQLVENDIPLVRRALGRPFSCAVLKGRANYLCRRRWRQFAAEPAFEFHREAVLFDPMRAFAEGTRTGDIAECAGVPEDARAWSEVNARSETCDPTLCADERGCFLQEARRRAAAADIVVVNHHLFFASLALRARGEREAGDGGVRGEVLPEAEAVVFDEAHGLEEAATAFFGVGVSLGRARELCRDVLRAFGRDGEPSKAVLEAAEFFGRAADVFFGGLGSGDGRFSLPVSDPSFEARVAGLHDAADGLSAAIALRPAGGEGGADRVAREREGLLRRSRSYVDDLLSALTADAESSVTWGERRGPSVSLWGTPLSVGSLLSEHLWPRLGQALLTSATLSVSRDFSYLKERIGLGGVDVLELIVDNEFDFAGQALAYVPPGLPEPGDGAFPSAAAREAARILALSGGGALVLCTSYRILGAMREALRGTLPFPVLVQGDASRMHLLRAFRNDGNAVLIGTGTFWEGIDVPGDALRCVIIDKLPFDSPADPVVAARILRLREGGADPFGTYQVPEAVLALRQGVGRLLRRSDDFGVVVILDHRVVTRSYGSVFRMNLPPMPWTRDRQRVGGFFRRFGGPQETRNEEDAR